MYRKCLLVLFIFMAVFVNGEDYGLPELLWKSPTEKGASFFPMTQDQSSDLFKAFEVKKSSNNSDLSTIKFDISGNKRREGAVFDNQYESHFFKTANYGLFAFKDGYSLRSYFNHIEFYTPARRITVNDVCKDRWVRDTCLDMKDKLVIVDYGDVEDKELNYLTAYDIINGKKVYDIEYETSNNIRAKLYFMEERIVIYENGSDLSIYKISDGSIVNRIKNFAGDVQNFDFYEIKESGDVYFLSINPGYICFMNLESGRVIANIKYKGIISDLTSLNQIAVKKVKSLFFITINTKSLENNFVICVNSMDSKVLWEKRIVSDRRIEFHEYEKSVILNDDNNVYCVDQTTGRELWHSEGITEISHAELVNKLYVVYCNDKSDVIAYNPQNGSVVWKYNMSGKFVSLYEIKGDFFICADSSNVAKIHIETGKVIWRSENLKDIYRLIYDYKENKLFTLNNKKRGVAEIDEESGRVKWRMSSASELVDAVYDRGNLYFVDKKNVYGVDTATGNNFLRCELGVRGGLTGLEYLKSRNQFVFFGKNRDMYIYDVKSNVVSEKITLRGSMEFAELKVIGKYLSVIEIEGCYGDENVNSYMTMVDLDDLCGLYSMVVGSHRFSRMSDFPEIYEESKGAYYNGEIMNNVCLFYPRLDLYKDNAMIIMVSDSDMDGVYCYRMFPGKTPTADEIKNIETHLFRFYNKL